MLGEYPIASVAALTNVCAVTLDDVPTLTVIVPVCLFKPFDVAVTKACVPPNAVIPTLTSNVSLVLFDTSNHLPLARSVAVSYTHLTLPTSDLV